MKEEIEKRLGFREKNRINVGRCVGFTLLTPRASHSNTQEYPQENLTEIFLIIHCPSYSLSSASLYRLLQSEKPHHNRCGTKFQ